MKLTTSSALALALTLGSGSCSSTRYDDPGAVETLTIGYGSTDLQSLAASMVESLVAAPALSYLDNPGKDGDLRIIVYTGDVENRTSEHIDTQGITDKIQSQLLKTGKFRFVAADAGQREIGDQVRFQQESGRVREDMMRAFGKQFGADVVLYGTLRSIEKDKKATIESAGVGKKDVYYQFVMKCADIDTGELLWIEEAELRKTARSGIFSRIG